MPLTREKNRMHPDVKHTLEKSGLMSKFLERPEYQQNDYLGWINRAKREETKQKRLDQMLEELKKGGVYMKMKHNPSK